MFGLLLSAELQGVTDLGPTLPYEFSFKIECTSCHEVHENWVTMNAQDKSDISGSRGDANFVFKCRFCKRESSATLTETGKTLNIDDKKPAEILQIDCRGLELKEFRADGDFQCKGESGTPFKEMDLTEGEWFDYDEKNSEEVSVTDVKWDIKRV